MVIGIHSQIPIILYFVDSVQIFVSHTTYGSVQTCSAGVSVLQIKKKS